MKYKYLFVIFLIINLYSCQKKVKTEENVLVANDSETNKEHVSDSLKEEDTCDDPSYEELVKGAYNDLLKSYHETKTIDTLFVIAKDTFHLITTYHCLLDSKVIVPKIFIEPFINERNEDFVTHNFMIKVEVYKNNQLYIDKEITKDSYIEKIDDENLKKYGILFPPGVRRDGHSVYIYNSLSIPTTDVGVGVRDTVKLE